MLRDFICLPAESEMTPFVCTNAALSGATDFKQHKQFWCFSDLKEGEKHLVHVLLLFLHSEVSRDPDEKRERLLCSAGNKSCDIGVCCTCSCDIFLFLTAA